MKRSEFPEKAFEELYLFELLTFFRKPGRSPFMIPSQVVEKQLGFDLCFYDDSGSPTFRKVLLIQFKISSMFTSKRNFGYFKFDIYKSKSGFTQHNHLCDYNSGPSGVAGIYCAPLFVSYRDFYKKFKCHSIIADSAMFCPTNKLVTGNHYVKFNSKGAIQCSKSGIGYKVLKFDNILQQLEPISLDRFKSIINKINENDSLVDNSQRFNESNLRSSYYLFI